MDSKVMIIPALIILLSSVSIQVASACGCGIAMTDMRVFNALKETQAYMLIDVQDETTYTEMPFFRFVSMDEPHNVTIVFPMSQVPYDVDGKKIKARQFLNDYGIYEAERNSEQQDLGNLVEAVEDTVFGLANGLVPFFMYFMSMVTFTGYAGTREQFEPIAHFEFEGGSLDIYNITSMQTLGQFAEQVDIELTEEVLDLVNKYRDYYVAVLYLEVPSVIDQADINMLELCMPEALKALQDRLAGQSEFQYYELEKIISDAFDQGFCPDGHKNTLRRYVYAAVGQSGEVEGTLVIMQFRDSSEFFYPTSVVQSYKYPIPDQKYYIKVPERLHVELSSSEIARTTNFGGERWYRVDSTQQDLLGRIVQAGADVRSQDSTRSMIQGMYKNQGMVILLVYLLLLALPLIIFNRTRMLSAGQTGVMVPAVLGGGLLLGAILMARKKNMIGAMSYLAIWAFLLVLVLV